MNELPYPRNTASQDVYWESQGLLDACGAPVLFPARVWGTSLVPGPLRGLQGLVGSKAGGLFSREFTIF